MDVAVATVPCVVKEDGGSIPSLAHIMLICVLLRQIYLGSSSIYEYDTKKMRRTKDAN